MRKQLFFAVSLVAALAWAAPASADTILFDVNGTGGGTGTTLATNFDWLPGNAILIETSPTTATVVYQANLGVITTPEDPVCTNVAGGAACNGANSLYYTAVASFNVQLTSETTFDILAGGTFSIYADAAPADDLTGGGAFADGTLVATGTAILGTGSLTPSFAPACAPGTTPTGGVGSICIGALDQTTGDPLPNNDWPGVQTIGGTGGFNVLLDVDIANPLFFLNQPQVIVVSATSSGSNTLPFLGVDPTALFWNGQAGVPSVGPLNGAGTRIMTQSDADTQFQVTVIPEPATLTLLGMGLAGSAIARRRQLKKRQQ